MRGPGFFFFLRRPLLIGSTLPWVLGPPRARACAPWPLNNESRAVIRQVPLGLGLGVAWAKHKAARRRSVRSWPSPLFHFHVSYSPYATPGQCCPSHPSRCCGHQNNPQSAHEALLQQLGCLARLPQDRWATATKPSSSAHRGLPTPHLYPTHDQHQGAAAIAMS